MNILDEATELTQGEVWPCQLDLYPDDDMVIEIVIIEEPAADSIGDSYEPMEYKTFKAMLEADMAWVADTVSKMTYENKRH